MVEIRLATQDDWAAMHRADGRIFGATYSEEDRAALATVIAPDRFRLAVDDGTIVGIAGAFAFDMTMPGGATVPTAGVTWVSVAVTHRRRGLLGRLMDAIHADADARGEALAALTASEGGIYERFGYGIATRSRVTRLERHRGALRPELVPATNDVRLVEPLDALAELMELWERYRLSRPGEVGRSESWWRWMIKQLGERAVWVMHPDGFTCWTLEGQWHDGHPAHEMALGPVVALTPEAHAALWHTVLAADLVGPIVSRRLPLDDPLPFLLRDQRALRTTDLNDGVWCHPRDVARCFRARTAWGTDDDVVVEADGTRWRLGASGARRVRSRADLVTDRAGLGSLLLGGTAPTTLAAGRRLRARSPEALRRADALFVVHPGPHCVTGF